MSTKKKLLEKIKRNPKSVRFEDLEKLFKWYGFELQVTDKGTKNPGSHYYYVHPSGHTISVPYRRPHLKEHYVKEAINFFNQIDLQDEIKEE